MLITLILSIVIGAAALGLLIFLFVREGKREEEAKDPNIALMRKIRAHGDPAIISLFENAKTDEERAEIAAFIDTANAQEEPQEAEDLDEEDDDEYEEEEPKKKRGFLFFGRNKNTDDDDDEEEEEDDDEQEDTADLPTLADETADIEEKEDDLGITAILGAPAYNFWKDPAVQDDAGPSALAAALTALAKEEDEPENSEDDSASIIEEANFEPTMVISKEELQAQLIDQTEEEKIAQPTIKPEEKSTAQAVDAAEETSDDIPSFHEPAFVAPAFQAAAFVAKLESEEPAASEDVAAQPAVIAADLLAELNAAEQETTTPPAAAEPISASKPIAEESAISDTPVAEVKLDEPIKEDTSASPLAAEAAILATDTADEKAADEAAATTESEQLCSVCGNPIDEGNSFCVICGTAVSADKEPETNQPEAQMPEPEPVSEFTSALPEIDPIEFTASVPLPVKKSRFRLFGNKKEAPPSAEDKLATEEQKPIAEPVVISAPTPEPAVRDIWAKDDDAIPASYLSGAPLGGKNSEETAPPVLKGSDPAALAAYQASIAAARAAAQARGVWPGMDEPAVENPAATINPHAEAAPVATPPAAATPAAEEKTVPTAEQQAAKPAAEKNPFSLPDDVVPVAQVTENTISLQDIIKNVKALEERIFAEAANPSADEKPHSEGQDE